MHIIHNEDTTFFYKTLVDAKEKDPCAMVMFDGQEYTSFFCKEKYSSKSLKLQASHNRKEDAYSLVSAYVQNLKDLDKDQLNQVV